MISLLDTNAYTAMARGDDAVLRILRRSERLLLSAVVIGELMYGFRNGTRCRANLEQLGLFSDQPWVKVLPVGRTTADRYSRIASQLRLKGRPLPTNDIWVAAHAMETGADLISFDRHFALVDGLVWIDPAA